MEYKLQDNETVDIKEFKTRKISRGFTETLLEWSTIGLNWEASINASNSEKANDYLVKEMTWLSQKQIDELHNDDYVEILAIINWEETTPRK